MTIAAPLLPTPLTPLPPLSMHDESAAPHDPHIPDLVTLRGLVGEAVRRCITPDATVGDIALTPLQPGMSGAPVYRCSVTLLPHPSQEGSVPPAVTLVLKKATRTERRVLALLNTQRQIGVPFSYSADLDISGADWVLLEDAGDTNRPSSLHPITERELRGEAEGLAAIHARNRGRGADLTWLPRVNQAYVTEYVLGRCFRPAWERALSGGGSLAAMLAPYASAVEGVARRLPAEMEPLLDDEATQTLVHTDVNPTNVRIRDGRPLYIDWAEAHYGTLFLDLPHHFCTRSQAEYYRRALAAEGMDISAEDFTPRYRTAARLIGFRYIWWTLEGWRGTARDSEWVHHYLRLIAGRASWAPVP